MGVCQRRLDANHPEKKVKAQSSETFAGFNLKSNIFGGSFKTRICWGLFLVCLNGKAGGASVFHG